MVKYLGYIDAEGGPIIVVDLNLAPLWRGTDDDGEDYRRACEFFDANPAVEGGAISIASGTGTIWELNGAGTVDIFEVGNNCLTIIRPWLDAPQHEPSDQILPRLAEAKLVDPIELTELEVPSAEIVILWAAESGIGAKSIIGEKMVRRPTEGLSLDTGALIVPTKAGKYTCLHDTVTVAGSEARRLHLIPI